MRSDVLRVPVSAAPAPSAGTAGVKIGIMQRAIIIKIDMILNGTNLYALYL
jgi:hypothetical protein